MSQGPLCPNLIKKVQKEVSQMANRKLSCAMLYKTPISVRHVGTSDGVGVFVVHP